MSEFLFQYHRVSPTTWAYLSSLLMIGLFFKFGRFWSVRNLDLFLLILVSPGLLLVHFGRQVRELERPPTSHGVELQEEMSATDSAQNNVQNTDGGEGSDVGGQVELETEHPASSTHQAPQPTKRYETGCSMERWGFFWLFVAGGFVLIRLLVDSMMVRRPLLLPNLSVGGLTFISCALFIFLVANVIVSAPARGSSTAELAAGDREAGFFQSEEPSDTTGPGHAALNVLPRTARKSIAVVSIFAICLGMAFVGYWHFDNITMGIGAAMVYLMIPYTSQMTQRVDHSLPAALLVWTILSYRRPIVAGMFFGLASGFIYYPLFLLPLWASFYWHRGIVRFLCGALSMLVVLSVVLAFTPGENSILADFQRMFGLIKPRMENLGGIWNSEIDGWDSPFRLPVLAAFVALSGSFALWPAQKNLGTLMSCSAAVMLATQFWHGSGGGTYLAWYIPLTLLTIFRPNLEDRIALSVLTKGWRVGRPVIPGAENRAAFVRLHGSTSNG